MITLILIMIMNIMMMTIPQGIIVLDDHYDDNTDHDNHDDDNTTGKDDHYTNTTGTAPTQRS